MANIFAQGRQGAPVRMAHCDRTTIEPALRSVAERLAKPDRLKAIRCGAYEIHLFTQDRRQGPVGMVWAELSEDHLRAEAQVIVEKSSDG